MNSPRSERFESGFRRSAASAAAVGMLAPLLVMPPVARAQTTVGPGPVTAPLNVPAGTTTTVDGGSTITATGSTAATNVNGGTLILDGSDGPIVVQTFNGTALNTVGGSINIPNGGVTVSTTGVGSALVVSGGSAGISGLTVNNAGASGGHGILANPGGAVTLGGGNSLNVTGSSVLGIAANSGGTVTATELVNLSAGRADGFGAFGVYVRGPGSTVALPANSTLNMSGLQAVGVTSSGTGASILPGAIGPGLTINLNTATTPGASSTGVLATSGGSAELRDVTVQGPNVGAGAWAQGAGSVVTLSGQNTITVTTAANPAFSTIGLWNPTGTPIFSGATGFSSAAGLLATQGGTVVSSGTTVSVPASPAPGQSSAAGAHASLNGSIDLTNNTINTTGNGSFGFRIDSGQITARNTQVTTSGGGVGMFINYGPGAIDLTNSTVQANGPRTVGLYSLNGTAGTIHTVRISGGGLASAEAYAIGARGPLDVTVTDGAKVSGAQALVAVFDQTSFPQPTVVNIKAAGNSVLSGDAYGAAASVLDIGLATASSWSGAAFNVTNASIDPTSTWNVTGNSVVTGQVANAGLVAFTPPGAGSFKTLTTRNYVGSGASTLSVNTFLGSDGSPSDKLIVNGGTASGPSSVRVTNAGGPGALTLTNGIMVVDAVNGGTTQPDAFTVNGRAVAGAYEYRLFRGSVDNSNGQAWYLRSDRSPPEPDPPPPPAPPGPAPAPVPPVPPGPPTPNVLPVPLYRPEVGAYLANPRIAVGFLVHSLHDRLGEPQWTEQQTFDNDNVKRSSVWARIVGRDVNSRTSDDVFGVESQTWLLHAGGEVAQWSVLRGDDRMHLGGMVSYGWGSSEAQAAGNPFGAKGESKGVTIGAYGTWFQNDETRLGWYADVWGQYGWFDNRVNGDHLPSVAYDSRFLALSGETGYAWLPDKSRDLVIEPQAQLIWISGQQDGIVEPNGTRIGDADGNGWISRLGVRTHRTWIHDSGDRTQLYATLNWWHDAVSNQMAFNALRLRDLYPSDRYEIKVGADLQRGKGWTAWGNVGYEWGEQSYRAVTARVGVKRTW